ncbi:hypothetical protein ACFP3I_16330 [Chryseobacterium arachidis]
MFVIQSGTEWSVESLPLKNNLDFYGMTNFVNIFFTFFITMFFLKIT